MGSTATAAAAAQACAVWGGRERARLVSAAVRRDALSSGDRSLASELPPNPEGVWVALGISSSDEPGAAGAASCARPSALATSGQRSPEPTAALGTRQSAAAATVRFAPLPTSTQQQRQQQAAAVNNSPSSGPRWIGPGGEVLPAHSLETSGYVHEESSANHLRATANGGGAAASRTPRSPTTGGTGTGIGAGAGTSPSRASEARPHVAHPTPPSAACAPLPSSPGRYATLEMRVLEPRAAMQQRRQQTAGASEATQVNTDAAGMDDAVAPPTDVTNLSRGERKELSRRRAAASLKIMSDRARPTTWTGGKLGARREAKAQLLSGSLVRA